jgi:hypothetical protein
VNRGQPPTFPDPSRALQFAIAFAQEDLDGLSQQRLRRRAREVEAFIAAEELSDLPAHPYSAQELKVFQSQLRRLLQQFAIPSAVRLTMTGNLKLNFLACHDGDHVRISVAGSALHRLLYKTIRVLQAAGTTRLLACPEPNCQRLFLKVTQKRFCSSRCQWRHDKRTRRAQDRAERLRFMEQEGGNGKATRTR